MSEVAKFLAQVGGALSANALGGGAGVQNYIAGVYKRQEGELIRDAQRQMQLSSQMHDLHRDRMKRDHDKSMQKARLKGAAATGPQRAMDNQVNSFMALAKSATSGTENTAWQETQQGLTAAGYIPETGNWNMDTPAEEAAVRTTFVNFVSELGPVAARAFWAQGGRAAQAADERYKRETGVPPASGLTAEDKLQSTQLFQEISVKLQGVNTQLGALKSQIDVVPQVGANPDAASIYGSHLELAEKLAKLDELMDAMGQNPAYIPLLGPTSPLTVTRNEIETRLEASFQLFDANREVAKLQLERGEDFGKGGTALINTAGYGGGKSENGKPTELHEREKWYASTDGLRQETVFAEVVDIVMNLQEGEAAQLGLIDIQAQFQKNVADGVKPTLRHYLDTQFLSEDPGVTNTATSVISSVYNMHPEGTQARVTELRTAGADRQSGIDYLNDFNLQVGHQILKPGEVDAITSVHGKQVEVPTGEGGSYVVRRFGTGAEAVATMDRWIRSSPDAMNRLAQGVVETAPPKIAVVSGDVMDQFAPGSLVDRANQIAAKFHLNPAKTAELHEAVSQMDPATYKIADNPLAKAMPTPSTPVLDGISSATNTSGVGGGFTHVLSEEDHTKVKISRRNFLFDGGRFASDKARQATFDKLSALASKARPGVEVEADKGWLGGWLGGPDEPQYPIQYAAEAGGEELISIPDLVEIFSANGHPFFRNTFANAGLAGERAAGLPGFDSTYIRGANSLLGRYKSAGGDDQDAMAKLSLLDAMRAQTGETANIGSDRSAEQRGIRGTMVGMLRDMSDDDIMTYFIQSPDGKALPGGIPFSSIPGFLESTAVPQAVLINPESLIDFSGDKHSLRTANADLKREKAHPTAAFGRTPGPRGDTNIYAPLDDALIDGLIADNTAGLEAIEDFEATWQADDVSGLYDGTLGRLFSPTASEALTDPLALFDSLDYSTARGKENLAHLAGVPIDALEEMFVVNRWSIHISNIEESTNMRDSLGHVLELVKDVSIARTKATMGNQQAVPLGLATKRKRILDTRIDDLLNTWDDIGAMLTPEMKAHNFNPVIAEILASKGFNNLTSETARHNTLFGAFLLAK